MNWVYERWIAPTWSSFDPSPVVYWIKKPYPWECTALMKEGPKALVLVKDPRQG